MVFAIIEHVNCRALSLESLGMIVGAREYILVIFLALIEKAWRLKRPALPINVASIVRFAPFRVAAARLRRATDTTKTLSVIGPELAHLQPTRGGKALPRELHLV